MALDNHLPNIEKYKTNKREEVTKELDNRKTLKL